MRLYFSLARELKMTVQYLMENMTSEELSYWVAFYQLEKEDGDRQSTKEELKNKVSKH